MILAVTQSWPGALLAAVVLGAVYGVYTAVDFALITQVLPPATARAKDLGVINIANALPQVFAPLLATLLVTLAGGYTSLYLVLRSRVPARQRPRLQDLGGCGRTRLRLPGSGTLDSRRSEVATPTRSAQRVRYPWH